MIEYFEYGHAQGTSIESKECLINSKIMDILEDIYSKGYIIILEDGTKLCPGNSESLIKYLKRKI